MRHRSPTKRLLVPVSSSYTAAYFAVILSFFYLSLLRYNSAGISSRRGLKYDAHLPTDRQKLDHSTSENFMNWLFYRQFSVVGNSTAPEESRAGKRLASTAFALRKMMLETAALARAWEERENDKLQEILATGKLEAVRGVSSDGLLVSKYGYERLHAGDVIGDGDTAVCMDGEVGLVPNVSPEGPARAPCVGIVSNSLFAEHGKAISVPSQTLYEISGGCCSVLDWKPWNWKSNEKNVINVGHDSHLSLRGGPGYQTRIVLNIRHHHDVTYSHVLGETLPRFLSMVPLLNALPEVDVAIGDSDLAEELLCMLGLDRKRIRRLDKSKKTWTYASVTIFPPPPKDRFFYPKSAFSIAVRNVLREATIEELQRKSGKAIVADPKKGQSRPLLVLMERGYNRKPGTGACKQNRCVQNFVALRDALKSSLGHEYRLETYPPNGSISTAVRLFSAADLVVGVHGGGFRNIIFCKPNTTVVHIGWGDHYKSDAEEYGLKYRRVDVPGLTRHTRNVVIDVPAIVAFVKEASTS